MGLKTQLITGGAPGICLYFFIVLQKANPRWYLPHLQTTPNFGLLIIHPITLRESNVAMENHPYFNHLHTFFSHPHEKHMKTSFFTCHLWFPDGMKISHDFTSHFLRQDGEEFNFFGRTGQRPTGEPINGYLAGDRTVSSLGLRPDSEIAIAPKDVMDVFFPYEDDDEGPFFFLNRFCVISGIRTILMITIAIITTT